MDRKVAVLLLNVLLVLGATGCARAESVLTAPRPVGEVLQVWSQTEHDLASLDRWLGGADFRVLRTVDGRERFLEKLPDSLDAGAVPSVDMASSLIVVGGYHKCLEEGVVLTRAGSDALRFTTAPASEESTANCAWAPYTVEVWRVPLAEL